MLDELMHPDEVTEEEATDEEIVHPEELEQEDEEEVAEETEDLVEEEESELDALRAKISELETFIRSNEGLPKAEAAEDLPFELPKLEGVQVLADDEDASDFFTSAEGINALSERIVGIAVEQALRLAYPVMQRESQRTVAEYDYSKTFYDKYPELRGQGELVAQISTELEKKDPSIKPQKLALETAKAAYKKIGKPMPSERSKRKPGFTNATAASGNAGTRRRPPGIEGDVLDLVKHKRRY